MRQNSSVFSGKDGYITPRDLLRWAERKPLTYPELAHHGYFLLAERLRRDEEKVLVKAVIEKHCRSPVNLDQIYGEVAFQKSESVEENNDPWSPHNLMQAVNEAISSGNMGDTGLNTVALTQSLRRLLVLVGQCIRNSEPVLLVGETGCGKTTVIQLLSIVLKRQLRILNCHANTETADILGGLRPVRGRMAVASALEKRLMTFLNSYIQSQAIGTTMPVLMPPEVSTALEKNTAPELDILYAYCEKLATHGVSDILREMWNKCKSLHARYVSLFEWVDGPLVSAMRNGDFFLLDEMSLAEDAVLERLNSVLEPSRHLTLAEKGGITIEEVTATEYFRIFATMNPGGDFGKRELSPALRNRFTEIWVPSLSDRADLGRIIGDRIAVKSPALVEFAGPILDYVDKFKVLVGDASIISIRDLLSWSSFIADTASRSILSPWEAYAHGASMVFLDGLGLGTGISAEAAAQKRQVAYDMLLSFIPEEIRTEVNASLFGLNSVVSMSDASFGIPPFSIATGKAPRADPKYAMTAKVTKSNIRRLMRSLQLRKPILMEGSPGVGKTSLVCALAKASGHNVVRINLSEQTDMSDLLGTDLPLPVDGENNSSKFAWMDGVFLKALKAGDWVLLDELNLASQAVLEGLNSVLDHRETVYIPELDMNFQPPSSFRIFAAQNPIQEGGGRKGLPKSFLNRFNKVYVDSLDQSDLLFIASTMHPKIDMEILQKLISFNMAIHEDVVVCTDTAHHSHIFLSLSPPHKGFEKE